MAMVVVEMHCTCGAHERIVTSSFALPMGAPSSGASRRVTVTRSASTSMTGGPVSPTEGGGK